MDIENIVPLIINPEKIKRMIRIIHTKNSSGPVALNKCHLHFISKIAEVCCAKQDNSEIDLAVIKEHGKLLC